MMSSSLIDQLHQLKLAGMASALQRQLEQPEAQGLSFDERLALLLDQEALERDNRRLSRLLKAAKLRINACVEEVDYRHPRGIDRGAFVALTHGHWIEQIGRAHV